MNNSLAKRIVVYLFVTVVVVGGASGLTWVLTDASNADYPIPQNLKAVREEGYDYVVKVVNEDNKPVQAARIQVRWAFDPNSAYKAAQIFSNEDGMAYINTYGDHVYYLELEVRARGYQTLHRYWGDRRDIDKKVDFPEELTVQLPKGQTIGGIVVTQLGEPVVGAKVELRSQRVRGDNNEYNVSLNESTPTDAQGRWELTNAPLEMAGLNINVSHSSHLENRDQRRSYQSIDAEGIKQMITKTHRLEMKRGVVIQGKITDAEGLPVANAIVIQGRDPYNRPNYNYQPRSDFQGNYRYKLGVEGSDVLTILSRDYKPTEVPVEVSYNMAPVNVQLEKGSPVEIDVKGEDGNSLRDVQVYPQGWENNSCLSLLYTREDPLKSNDQGKVIWENAPAAPIQFAFTKDGLMYNYASLAPQEEPHEITMLSTRTVNITAVDAQSGKPINNFIIEEGYLSGTVNNIAQYHYGYGQQNVAEKTYAHNINNSNSRIRLRVRAAGYKPAETPEIIASEMQELTTDIAVKMQPGVGPAGRVLDPDGNPVADATVLLFNEHGQAQLANGEVNSWGSAVQTKTNAQGEFKFEPQGDDFGLLAAHESGVIKISMGEVPEKGDYQLQKWATLSGQLLRGTEPVPDKDLNLYPRQKVYKGDQQRYRNDLTIQYSTRTDSNGAFEFKRVLPGVFELHEYVQVPMGQGMYRVLGSGRGRYEVNAGEDNKIVVGEHGDLFEAV
ncbi:MAG: carboxypeptidase-like regulatory domain-containing protein [Planctomycetaceae bacterium]